MGEGVNEKASVTNSGYCICFRGPQMTIQFKLGDSKIPGMDERLVAMCPGEIRRLSSPSPGNISIHMFFLVLT